MFVCGVCTVVCVCMFVVVCTVPHTVLTSGLVCYALLCFWLYSPIVLSLFQKLYRGYLCRAEASAGLHIVRQKRFSNTANPVK